MSGTIDPELRRAVIEIVDERIRELEVRRSDFIGLKKVIQIPQWSAMQKLP